MAKLGFTKLGLKPNMDIVEISFNDSVIEVKQYLSTEDKIDLVTAVLELSHDQNNFANPIKIMIYTGLLLVEKYTNITFTEKQKENPAKLYDLLNGNGVLELITSNIPEKELQELYDAIEKTIVSVYKYNNSLMGMMDAMSSDYSALELDANKIHQTLAEPTSMEFLKQIMTRLG